MILTTHHHMDHVEANLALKERFKLRIVGPEAEKAKIPGIDETVEEGSVLHLGDERIEVIATPPATPPATSPTICRRLRWRSPPTRCFALGCGRLFECKPPVMYESLQKLAALPADTVIYCGHEYTLANARFALTVDPTIRL